jgi:hypothetical protein
MPDDSYGKIIGPVYSLVALAGLWDCGEQEAEARAGRLGLLALQVGDRKLYPAFQLDGGEPREDVAQVVRILRVSVDPETIAQWLMTPCAKDSKSRSHTQLLDAGHARCVQAEAVKEAARWADQNHLSEGGSFE